MVEARYTVHSAHETDVAVELQLNGQPVMAKVTGLVVELMADNGTTCHTHRFLPSADELESYKELFAEGNAVTLTFSAA